MSYGCEYAKQYYTESINRDLQLINKTINQLQKIFDSNYNDYLDLCRNESQRCEKKSCKSKSNCNKNFIECQQRAIKERREGYDRINDLESRSNDLEIDLTNANNFICPFSLPPK